MGQMCDLQHFLQLFAVALSPFLVNGVGPQNQEPHSDEDYGHRRDQNLQGWADSLGLGALASHIPSKSAKTRRINSADVDHMISGRRT